MDKLILNKCWISPSGRFWIHLPTGRSGPVIAGGSDMFTPHLARFRCYGTGTESGSSALAAEDINISIDVSAGNVDFQYRILIEEQGNASGTTMDDWQVEVEKNALGFVDLTASDPGSGILGVDAGLTNDAATTNRSSEPISDPGAGSFDAGEQSNDGVVDNMQLTANNFTEHVYGVRVIADNVADADTFKFRLRTPSSIVNDITLTVTIIKGGAPVTKTKTVDFDAKIQEQGLQKTIDYDAKVLELARQKTVDYDALVLVEFQKVIDFDAKVLELAKQKTLDFDALVLVQAQKTVDFDARIFRANLTKTINFDAVISTGSVPTANWNPDFDPYFIHGEDC